MGVDVFFVLSGYLITGILRKEYARTGTIRLLRFTRRRLIRLYPALVVVCAFVLVISLVARTAVREVGIDVFHALTYTSNIWSGGSALLDHTWTLSLEEQFYLLWPFLLWIALRSSTRWAWLPTAIVIGTVLSLDLFTGQSGALHTYVRAMGLPVGCVLAFATPTVLRTLRPLALLSGPALLILFFVPLPAYLTTGWPISIGALLAAPLVAALVTTNVRPLARGPLCWLGLRSYSLYLWHLPIMLLVFFHSPDAVPVWIRPIAAIVVSLLFAEASYRYVEQPFLRLRDRGRRRGSSLEAPVPRNPSP